MSRRDEVWEMKRQRFFNNQNNPGQANHAPMVQQPSRPQNVQRIETAPMSFDGPGQVPGMPTSPLSKLVQDGYGSVATPTGAPTPRNGPPSPRRGGAAMLPPRAPSAGHPQGGSQGGFNPAVAEQWNSNVQQTTAAYQQQHDPNYVARYTKPNGYRVSHAPGGGSSISLSWNDNAAAGPSNNAASRYRSPGAAASSQGGMSNCFGGAPQESSGSSVRRPSPGGMAACLGGGTQDVGGSSVRRPSPGAMAAAANLGQALPSYGSNARAPSPGGMRAGGAAGVLGGATVRGQSPGANYGGASCGSQYGASGMPYVGGGNLPPPVPGNRYADAGREASGMAWGARGDSRSSNSYACGANQNCGNVITDRRTTRVAQPPGGGSSISFG